MARKKSEKKVEEETLKVEILQQFPIPTPIFDPNLTIDQIIADLKGFGIEPTKDTITLKAGEKLISIRLSNIPNEAEIDSLTAAEGLKGHIWISKIKCEVLSRSISWINGVDLKNDSDIFLVNPITGVDGHIRPILRDLIMGWGQEVVNVLWRVLMNHCQGIEDRLFESLPESAVLTEVEKRFMEKALEEITEVNREVYKETVKS